MTPSSARPMNKARTTRRTGQYRPLYCIYVAVGQKEKKLQRGARLNTPRERRRHALQQHHLCACIRHGELISIWPPLLRQRWANGVDNGRDAIIILRLSKHRWLIGQFPMVLEAFPVRSRSLIRAICCILLTRDLLERAARRGRFGGGSCPRCRVRGPGW